MKYEFKGDKVVLTADTLEENHILLALGVSKKITTKRRKRGAIQIALQNEPVMQRLNDIVVDGSIFVRTADWTRRGIFTNSMFRFSKIVGKRFATKKSFGGWRVKRTA